MAGPFFSGPQLAEPAKPRESDAALVANGGKEPAGDDYKPLAEEPPIRH
jgi:hypothetical protein